VRDPLAARITWLLLWPVLVVVGLFDFTVLALTCGTDGLVNYGDPEAMRFCSRVAEQESEYTLIGFAPLALLAFGGVLWFLPEWLKWLNVAAFVLAGVISAALTLVATATALAVMIAFAWWLILVVSVVIERETRASRRREQAAEAAAADVA
jgi:hypothetical protein